MARKFEGNMKDSEVLEVLNIDRKTYYIILGKYTFTARKSINVVFILRS